MEIFSIFNINILNIINTLQKKSVIKKYINTNKITSESPKKISFGDLSTNVSMILSSQLKISSYETSIVLIKYLKNILAVEKVLLTPNGFINIFISKKLWIIYLKKILKLSTKYGDLTIGNGKKVNIEYVSVNPTGPIHIGHSRIAILGDVQASLFEKAGYKVTREYYINDAGSQIDLLSQTILNRYLKILGFKYNKTNSYPGKYLIPISKTLVNKYSNKLTKLHKNIFCNIINDFAVQSMMFLIKSDLLLLGINHDIFTSEKKLLNSGKIEEAINLLTNKKLIYQGVLNIPKGGGLVIKNNWTSRSQILFKSKLFGDDEDRPLTKSDGTWTYFASDIAYHLNKYKRGFDIIINIWGSDHGGYIKRLKSAVHAVIKKDFPFKIHLCSMVRFIENENVLKMSKRKGNFITIKNVVDKVGSDVLRFIMMTRKSDAPLDFNLDQIIKNSQNSPVFYIQYAYARSCSIQKQIYNKFPNLELNIKSLLLSNFSYLKKEYFPLVKLLTNWPKNIYIATKLQEPHRIAFYLNAIATNFHSLWSKGKKDCSLRFISSKNPELTKSRFVLIKAVKIVIESGLSIFNIKPKDKMF